MESSALTLISEIGPKRHLVLNEEGRLQYLVENGDELLFFDDLKPITTKTEEKVESRSTANAVKLKDIQKPLEAPKEVIENHAFKKIQEKQLIIYIEKLDTEQCIKKFNLNNNSKINVINNSNIKIDSTHSLLRSKFACGRPYECKISSKKYHTSTNLKMHEYNVHYSETRHHICDFCDKRFNRKDNLKLHIRIHTGEKPYKCNKCNKRFTRKEYLNKHKNCKSDTGFPSSLCSKIHSKAHTSQSPAVARSNKYNICENDFTGNKHIKTYDKKNTEERPYKCNVCDKRFTTNTNLKLHLRTHIVDKPYKCSICDKGYASIAHMKRHEQLHMDERPYKCTVCDKRFTTSTHLKIHMRTHTGEKPYKCDMCNKRFTTGTGLTLHIRTHTGEKPYKCNMCDESFIQKVSLLVHVRKHSGDRPFKCKVCGKGFTGNASMRNHERRHGPAKSCVS